MHRNFFLIFSLLFLFTSCISNPHPDPFFNPFIGGVNGIRASVLDGAPPPVITDFNTMPFTVGIVLENAGESHVGPGTENPFVLLRLSGIRAEDWNLDSTSQTTMLDQRLGAAKKNFDGTILPGEVNVLTFEDLAFKPRMMGSELFTINAEICHDYTTHTNLKVCIKDDIREHLVDSTVCMLRSELEPLNSGAYVHVVEAKQNPVGENQIQVNFAVANVGQGVFFNRAQSDPMKACSLDSQNPDLYRALIVVSPVDPVNYALDCRGLDKTKPGFSGVNTPAGADYGVIRFHSNAPRSISCFLEKTTDIGGRMFQDMMQIDIYYRYNYLIDMPILVQDFAQI